MQYQLGLFQDQTAWLHRCIFHLSFLHQSNLHPQRCPFSGIKYRSRTTGYPNRMVGQSLYLVTIPHSIIGMCICSWWRCMIYSCCCNNTSTFWSPIEIMYNQVPKHENFTENRGLVWSIPYGYYSFESKLRMFLKLQKLSREDVQLCESI